MDVHRLRILRELADRGTVAATATAVGMTPSAVSQQLASLTRDAGVPLTERIGRGLRLTAAGEALADAAVDVDGVIAIYTHEDLPGAVGEPLPVLIPHPALTAARTGYPLAKGEVNHVGEAVVMVVATNRYVAEDAVDRTDEPEHEPR